MGLLVPFLLLASLAGGSAFVPSGARRAGDGAWRLEAGDALRSAQATAGDLVIVLDAFGAPQGSLEVGVEGEWRLELDLTGRDSAGLRIEAGAVSRSAESRGGRFEVRLRGPALEVRVGGRPVLSLVAAQPLGGGTLELRCAAGAVGLADPSVHQLPFRESVEVEGLDGAAYERLRGLGRSQFELLDPAPGLVDPVYRVEAHEAKGDSIRFSVGVCGLRPDPREIPLLDQALAFALVRPFVRCHLRIGEEGSERIVEEGAPLGPFRAPRGERVVFVCRALLGIGEEWPTACLRDPVSDRFLDRVVPGGPATREMWAVLPPDLDRVEVVVAVPGGPVWRHLVEIERTGGPSDGPEGSSDG